MAGNSIGKLFTVTSFGESHGPALGCIVDGCPPGLPLGSADLQRDLDRRKPGTSRFTTQRREADEVQILSGVFDGVTTGTSIGLLIENTDQRSKDYSNIKDRFRPAHADYTYTQKYGMRDYRGGGRSSARETAMRVAAGAIAKKYLATRYGIQVRGYLAQLGPIMVSTLDWDVVETNPFFCPDAGKVAEMEAFMSELNKRGDSIGACIRVVACCPAWQRTSRPADAGRFHRQQCGRYSGRDFQRSGYNCEPGAETHLQYSPARCHDRSRRQPHRDCNPRPTRPLCGHPGDANCRSDAGDSPDGSYAATSGAEYGCTVRYSDHSSRRARG